jgi:hypothetical protein
MQKGGLLQQGNSSLACYYVRERGGDTKSDSREEFFGGDVEFEVNRGL